MTSLFRISAGRQNHRRSFARPELEVAVNQLGKHFGRKPRIAKTAANGNGVHVPPPTTATAAAATSTPTPPPV